MTITLSPETEKALRDEAVREQKTPEQVAMEAMIAGLRHRRIPQTLDELPRRELPPGAGSFSYLIIALYLLYANSGFHFYFYPFFVRSPLFCS